MAQPEPSIYLDYNASAPLRPEARAAMEAALGLAGNPSSVHGFGRAARECLEAAREKVAALVNARPENVIFTSGGTEANNLALASVAGRPVIASAIEHDSVLQSAPPDRLSVTRAGIVDLAALERRLDGLAPGTLVSVMWVNNETGVIQPVEDIARLLEGRGIGFHSDAVQAAGRIALDMAPPGPDMITLSAHKIGGPTGVGALVLGDSVAGGTELAPLLRGGGQERGRRAGTENIVGIAGFGAAAAAARRDLATYGALADLRDSIEAALRATCPGIELPGQTAPRVANTLNVMMPGVRAETQLMALDLKGIAVSAGAACSSGKVQPSHVLRAMGYGENEAATALRVSLGPETRAAEVDLFVEAWCGLFRRLAQTNPAAA